MGPEKLKQRRNGDQHAKDADSDGERRQKTGKRRRHGVPVRRRKQEHPEQGDERDGRQLLLADQELCGAQQAKRSPHQNGRIAPADQEIIENQQNQGRDKPERQEWMTQ